MVTCETFVVARFKYSGLVFPKWRLVMPKATFVISDETLEEFKKLAKKRYGDKRGVLSVAIEEAIKDWIKKTKKELENAE
ncbi:hypothetical protein JCM16138_13820 [Thermococcus atlanticus]